MNRCVQREGVLSFLAGVFLLTAAPAWADVEGNPPERVGHWNLFGNYSAGGAPLMTSGPQEAETASILLPTASYSITDIPADDTTSDE